MVQKTLRFALLHAHLPRPAPVDQDDGYASLVLEEPDLLSTVSAGEVENNVPEAEEDSGAEATAKLEANVMSGAGAEAGADTKDQTELGSKPEAMPDAREESDAEAKANVESGVETETETGTETEARLTAAAKAMAQTMVPAAARAMHMRGESMRCKLKGTGAGSTSRGERRRSTGPAVGSSWQLQSSKKM